MFCTLQLLICTFQPLLTLCSLFSFHFHDKRWQTWGLRQPQYLFWLENIMTQLFKTKQIKIFQERVLPTFKGRFFCKSEQPKQADHGAGAVVSQGNMFSGNAAFNPHSHSCQQRTDICWKDFFFFNWIRSLIQFEIQSCKWLCCHN